jgi:hypothetical protein
MVKEFFRGFLIDILKRVEDKKIKKFTNIIIM